MGAIFRAAQHIVTQSGSVVAYGNAADSGSAYGMAAFASGSNRISTDSGSAVVYGIAESGESYGMVAQNAGTNSIETDSGAVMVESGSPTTSTGMWADSAGSANRITTNSGDVFLFADGFGSEDSKGMDTVDCAAFRTFPVWLKLSSDARVTNVRKSRSSILCSSFRPIVVIENYHWKRFHRCEIHLINQFG